MRKVIVFTALIVMMTSSIAFAESKKQVKVFVDNKEIHFTNQGPVIEKGRTLIPIRAVSENLGFKVKWYGHTQQIKLIDTTNGLTETINLQLNSDKVWVEKRDEKLSAIQGIKTSYRTYKLEVPPKAINGSTLLPIRDIVEVMGWNIAWDNKSYEVRIRKDNKVINYLDLLHYDNGKATEINNHTLEDIIIDAFSSMTPSNLSILGNQVNETYNHDEFMELKVDSSQGIKISNLNNGKLAKMMLLLKDGKHFKKGTLLTWDDSGNIRAWVTPTSILDNIFQNINKDIMGE